MPLLGDWTVPSSSVFVLARQPTAATTAPGLPVIPCFGLPCTTTSVTWLARKQPFAMLESPVQFGWPEATPAPVGRLTLVQLTPSSSVRKRPAPVAAYATLGLLGSTAMRKPLAPSGTPVPFCQVVPPSVER